MNKKILLWLDVEDYLTPESDDAFMRLLEIFDESGVKCTFKFCARKLDLFKTRGRTDILEKLANHEMSFHTTNHSIHPLPTEYLNGYGFRTGAAEFEKREVDGFRLISDISGQHETSYGQPREAWAPQVFPVLRKWGVPTYLDVHPIVGADSPLFWYGGVLCFTRLPNLQHLARDLGATNLLQDFDNMDTQGGDTIFVSVYAHPTEYSCSEFWDEVNFPKGRNPYTYQPAPLRAKENSEALYNRLREYINYTSVQPDVEYITASETMRYEHHRTRKITDADIETFARSFGNEVTYAEIGGEFLTASELLNLLTRKLTGRVLTPELIYGPEALEDSLITGTVSAKELAEAVYQCNDRVLGYKQLPSLYRVGRNFLNPVDTFCTLAKAVRENVDEVEPVKGRLAAADHVDETFQFGGSWVLWADDFRAENIVQQTKLQTWTLKPAIF